MEVLIEPANRRHDNYLAHAIISTRGYLDLPHSEEIAMRIPLKLPLNLAPENLILFVEKTIANCSNKPIYFELPTVQTSLSVLTTRKENLMKTPLSTQIKNIFEKALAEHKTTIHFEYYNSRYNITFNDSVNFNDIDNALEQPIYLDVETKQRLKNAINVNRKTYEFNMKSSHNALLATKDYPHIIIMNLKRKN